MPPPLPFPLPTSHHPLTFGRTIAAISGRRALLSLSPTPPMHGRLYVMRVVSNIFGPSKSWNRLQTLPMKYCEHNFTLIFKFTCVNSRQKSLHLKSCFFFRSPSADSNHCQWNIMNMDVVSFLFFLRQFQNYQFGNKHFCLGPSLWNCAFPFALWRSGIHSAIAKEMPE